MAFPAFIFKVDEMRPKPDVPPRIDTDSGDWRPPRPLESNYIADEGVWLYHPETGRHSEQVPIPANKSMPENLNHYKTCSMYYSDGTFWIVPYDATRSQVGNGSQEEDHEARRPSGWSDNSEESDQNGRDYVDWSPLNFKRLGNDTSFATIGAESAVLHAQPNNQYGLITTLLPDRYHSLNRTNTPGHGGLVGELPILIGLRAFMVPPRDVRASLNLGVFEGQWPSQLLERGLGWDNQRGLVVQTYTYTLNMRSNNEALEAFENGFIGPAYS